MEKDKCECNDPWYYWLILYFIMFLCATIFLSPFVWIGSCPPKAETCPTYIEFMKNEGKKCINGIKSLKRYKFK